MQIDTLDESHTEESSNEAPCPDDKRVRLGLDRLRGPIAEKARDWSWQ